MRARESQPGWRSPTFVSPVGGLPNRFMKCFDTPPRLWPSPADRWAAGPRRLCAPTTGAGVQVDDRGGLAGRCGSGDDSGAGVRCGRRRGPARVGRPRRRRLPAHSASTSPSSRLLGHLGSIHPGCPPVGAREVGASAGSPSRAAGPRLLCALTTGPLVASTTGSLEVGTHEHSRSMTTDPAAESTNARTGGGRRRSGRNPLATRGRGPGAESTNARTGGGRRRSGRNPLATRGRGPQRMLGEGLREVGTRRRIMRPLTQQTRAESTNARTGGGRWRSGRNVLGGGPSECWGRVFAKNPQRITACAWPSSAA